MTRSLSQGRRDGTRRRLPRWLLVVAGAVGLLLAACALAWFVWLPGYRPGLRPGERLGVDVSSHQGPIHWDRVRRAGMSFAYIKATEGRDFVDPSFRHNWLESRASGLDRGAYHFFTLCASGAEQAANFLRVVPDDPRMLPPALDLELAGNCSARPTTSAVQRDVEAFVGAVEGRTERPVLLYVGRDFERLYGLRSWLKRPLWVRRFLRRPDENWTVWQVDGFARVDGIEGRVDLDVMRGPGSGGAR